jgi:SAM-dependent methyltransferase
MKSASIPFPPLEYRYLIGPSRLEAFDNPDGGLLIPEIPPAAYETVLDFGCGCGRFARQMLQQNPRPRRYLGLDVHRGMIDWCTENLTPIEPTFRFQHHDVFSLAYGPDNSRRLAAPFPSGDAEFSLVLAHSVFTHLYKDQTEYYLHEIARALRPDGVAYTTWLLFDRVSFPFLTADKVCLFVDELDPTAAVIYDREWLLTTFRRYGLAVCLTKPPAVPGHQWLVMLEKRRPGAVDQFPLGPKCAEWLCGATEKARAQVSLSDQEREAVLTAHDPALKAENPDPDTGNPGQPPEPPFHYGPFDAILQKEITAVKRSWTWRVGRLIVGPWAWLRRWW